MDIIKQLKTRAEKENMPMPRLYQQEQTEIIKQIGNMEIVKDVFPKFRSVQGTLYNHRHINTPPLPRTLGDIVIENEWSQTEDGQQFLLYHERSINRDENMIIFASIRSLQVLSKCKRCMADGTFKTAAEDFTQLNIIHGIYKGHAILCVFGLLANKEKQTYKQMLEQIKEVAINNNVQLKPDEILTDFEKGAIGAFEFHFNVKSMTCFLHFG